MATMRGFSKRIKGVADDVPKNADKLVRVVAITTASVVVMGTPVDTGRARGNWQSRLGGPATGELPEPANPGDGERASLQQVEQVAGEYEGGVDFHITNNLPYIIPLNEGHSKQAPANFVQTAIRIGIDKVRKARLIR